MSELYDQFAAGFEAAFRIPQRDVAAWVEHLEEEYLSDHAPSGQRMRLVIRDELTRNVCTTLTGLSEDRAIGLVSDWIRGGVTGLAIELVHEL